MLYTPEGVAEANRIWREGLSRYPDSSLLKFKLGLGHYTIISAGWSRNIEDDARQAAEYARDGFSKVNLTPLESKLGHWLMVYVHLLNRDFKSSLGEAEIAVQGAPGDAWLHATLVDAAGSNRQFDKAVSWVDFGIKNDPVNTPLYLAWKGGMLMSAERYEESAEAYKGALEFDYVLLGSAINALHLNNFDEARNFIRKALKLNPNVSIKYWKATTFYPDDIIDRQIADLRKAGLPEG